MDALTMIGIVVVAVVSVTSHEAIHGFVADRPEESTAREQGLLTLNPIPHIDLFFTILAQGGYGSLRPKSGDKR